MADILEGKIGLWHSPYIKLYSLGRTERCAEISTYPRAYKDTSPHRYTSDIPFVVSHQPYADDYNFRGWYPDMTKYHYAEKVFTEHGIEHTWYGFADINENWFDIDQIPKEDKVWREGYLDSHSRLFSEGETAYHLTGEHLPGSFPLWIEDNALSFTPTDNKAHTIFCDGIPYPMKVTKVEVNKGAGWVEIAGDALKKIIPQLDNLDMDRNASIFRGKFSFAKPGAETNKILIRIYYNQMWG